MDPNAESYVEWSPYSFMGNNPVNNIDPTGKDWYKNDSTGGVLWVDSQDKTYTSNGLTYSNIGSSYSVEIGDGQYLNYYQNALVSISTGGAVNAMDRILSDDALMGAYLGKDSPLSDKYKSDLIVASIHRETDKWGKFGAMILMGEMGGMVIGGAVEGVLALRAASLASKTAIRTTAHGAERIAGAAATRGGVLTEAEIVAARATGQTLKQADGAIVKVQQIAGGRYNVVVEGKRGIITTFKNLSEKSLDRLSNNYGWTKAR